MGQSQCEFGNNITHSCKFNCDWSVQTKRANTFEPWSSSHPPIEIPPLWEVLRIPGPVDSQPDPVPSDEDEIDRMTNEQFAEWRRSHPRKFNPQEHNHAISSAISDVFDKKKEVDLGFSAHTLPNETEKDEENDDRLEEESEVSDFSNDSSEEFPHSESPIPSSSNFIACYEKLYREWRILHS